MKFFINYIQNSKQEAASLAVFRVVFGVLMFISMLRFYSYGWIDKLYIQPKFHFSYYGFQWVKPLGNYTYIIFVICALSALFVTLGYKYKIAIVSFFLSFTYIELMDKTTYLNHYYFISIVAFILIFLPANASFSIDAYRKEKYNHQFIPSWNTDILKIILAIVYFYAGLAKLNSDWLIEALPLKIWLPSKFNTPILGPFTGYSWVHYAFSWFGVVYDLSIPFLLLFTKTRKVAFFFVVVFHIATWALFPIGMFPFIMIGATLVFFKPSFHKKIISVISSVLKLNKEKWNSTKVLNYRQNKRNKLLYIGVSVFLLFQLLIPFRYVMYPGELFWTEEGYRFSWRVMLMEKTGYAQFKIVDQQTNKRFYVDNTDFLTPFQEKQMSFQPDFILEYAHYLATHFKSQGHKNIAVYVENYVSLNGRLSTELIDSKINLVEEKESFKHKEWIVPFKDEIDGL